MTVPSSDIEFPEQTKGPARPLSIGGEPVIRYNGETITFTEALALIEKWSKLKPTPEIRRRIQELYDLMDETSKYLAKDELGFTNPNLHRRTDAKDRLFDVSEIPDWHTGVLEDSIDIEPYFEYGPRSYSFYIMGLNSYRLTEIHNHDEDYDLEKYKEEYDPDVYEDYRNPNYWEIP